MKEKAQILKIRRIFLIILNHFNRIILLKNAPTGYHKKKKSKSRINFDPGNSPYHEATYGFKRFKSFTSFKQVSPVVQKKNLHYLADTLKNYKYGCPSEQNSFSFPSSATIAEDLEEELNEKIEKFKKGDFDNEFINELEIVDYIYLKVIEYMKPFEKVMKILRSKLEKCLYDITIQDFKAKFKEKLEKIQKKNAILIQKINYLSDIN